MVLFSRVCSSLNDNPGTLVTEEHPAMEAVVIRGVSIERSQARVTITNIPDTPGNSGKILGCLADAEINIDMIISNIASDGMARHSFTMHTNDPWACSSCSQARVRRTL